MEVNCIKVTNIPENVYDDYLVITFATVVEGLEVKTRVIRYDAEKATAIVDVETTEAVKKILRDYQMHPSWYDVNGKRLHVVEFTCPGVTEAFEQLKRNQVVFAECLERQCLDLADFPKTFEQVQRAAYSAMALHGDTVTLFDKFSVTVWHIALVPRSLHFIKLVGPLLVAGAFNEVLPCVTEMSSDADHIHSRYGALVSKIVECGKEIATAEDARKNQNRAEINKLDEQLHEAERTLYTLQERLVERGKRRDELQQRVETIFHEMKKHKPDGALKLGYNMVPNDKRKQGMEKFTGRGTKGDPVEESSKSLFSGLTKKMGSAMSHARHFSSDFEGERQQEKDTLQEEINKVDEQIHSIQSEKEVRNLQKMQLEDQKALKEAEKPNNAEGVRNAEDAVQGVIDHLSEICKFLTMMQNIQPLADEEEASNVYRSATGSNSAKEFFLEKMSLSLKCWERLCDLCMDYVGHFKQNPVEGLGRI